MVPKSFFLYFSIPLQIPLYKISSINIWRLQCRFRVIDFTFIDFTLKALEISDNFHKSHTISTMMLFRLWVQSKINNWLHKFLSINITTLAENRIIYNKSLISVHLFLFVFLSHEFSLRFFFMCGIIKIQRQLRPPSEAQAHSAGLPHLVYGSLWQFI